jgi:hypothetical protein
MRRERFFAERTAFDNFRRVAADDFNEKTAKPWLVSSDN